MLEKRVKVMKKINEKIKGVIYWMSRDQRVEYNHALLYAQKLALEKKLPLIVVFLLQKNFLNAPWRHYYFMLQGLKEVKNELKKLNINFYLKIVNSPKDFFEKIIFDNKISLDLITDFSPLKVKKKWLSEIKKLPINLYEVDTHNIIPYHQATDKKELAAFTLRKKILEKIIDYLIEPEKLIFHPYKNNLNIDNQASLLEDFELIKKFLKIDFGVGITKFVPGRKQALWLLKNFVDNGIENYEKNRNQLFPSYQSNFSPYLHFGQISSLEIVLRLKKKIAFTLSAGTFFDEIIVRKELADNFCYYEENYDNPQGFPNWAKETLKNHLSDKREKIYSLEELENSQTEDEIWNAAQMEMVKKGKMNGYLRMYWAKKLLEWTKTPEEAMKYAIYLNDKYELDGRDPNGYAGIAWSIGGVHDRPFFERPIYGLVRFISKKSIEKKFNVKGYISYVKNL